MNREIEPSQKKEHEGGTLQRGDGFSEDRGTSRSDRTRTQGQSRVFPEEGPRSQPLLGKIISSNSTSEVSHHRISPGNSPAFSLGTPSSKDYLAEDLFATPIVAAQHLMLMLDYIQCHPLIPSDTVACQ